MALMVQVLVLLLICLLPQCLFHPLMDQDCVYDDVCHYHDVVCVDHCLCFYPCVHVYAFFSFFYGKYFNI
jgi:hypothetical protein